MAKVIKLIDPSLRYLEVSTLVGKYPDIRDDYISTLLVVPGDTSWDMKSRSSRLWNRAQSRQIKMTCPSSRESVLSLTVAKLLK